ncbi:GNAT family N-acetyltransferase [Natronorubrum texcoconense]|uniref:Acetyltransferase (GNAT) domain-containing protein n=1 Tax=Natronorubrum texcoconense TaxID=1095776 RepID=A0A1G9FMM0_9EURY|nr:GNAT family N-acetyltransferase [Natronorubrum texcoconense]SDK89433.1 Acetyltransferase (GNAT) domain-containing protein [Natronorubrum texcoconense]
MGESTSPATQPSYTVRSFESSDRDALLSLYETVFEKERGADWFRWKYAENPYADHVPIVVADAGGELVGCRAFFALEMRVGDDRPIAFQPCDTMVHPEHRDRGLFSRMNEYALERYADGPPSLCFNFPNESAKPGNLKHGWKEIGTIPTYYRPQDPVESVKKVVDDGDGDESEASDETAASGDGSDGWVYRDLPPEDDTGDLIGENDGSDDGVAEVLSDVITSSQLAGDKLVTQADSEIAAIRFETPPAEVLESVYRRSIPDGIHTNRTAEFYRWRLENPARSYTTYVATRDGETPIAALVCSRVDDHLRIVESLPREITSAQDAINQLLAAALADCPDRNYVTAFGETLPTPIRYRFYPDTRFPLSTLERPTALTLLARDLDRETEFEETTRDEWTLSGLDVDTS